jgi:hypothetical protein
MGMIVSTIISQTSLVAAGFYTPLPPFLVWIRYISPVFYTFSGILKASYHWSDTYQCLKGQSDVGVNQCFLESNPGIANMQARGINVATFGDPDSDQIAVQVISLVLLYATMQLVIYVFFKAAQKAEDTSLNAPLPATNTVR